MRESVADIMRINLPNQITIARLFIAVIFFVCLTQFDASAPQPKWWLLNLSGALFVVAALTDALDGYLARKTNQITSFGRIIDPFVDKILVIGAYMFLAGDRFVDVTDTKISHVSDWMVVVILGRELFVTSLRGMTEGGGQSFAANAYGKAKMLLQSITVGWLLFTLGNPELFGSLTFLSPYVVYGMVIVTVLSAIPYMRMGKGILSEMAVKPK